MTQPLSHLVCNPTPEVLTEVIDTDAERWFNASMIGHLRRMIRATADDIVVDVSTHPAGMVDLGLTFRDGTGTEFSVWFYHVVWMDGFARVKNVLVPSAYTRAFQRPRIVHVRHRMQRFTAHDTTAWYLARVFDDFTVSRMEPELGKP